MPRLYQDKEWLYNFYVNKKWSQTEIGAFCDVSQATISKWLIKHNIECRSFSEGKYQEKNGSWVDSKYKDYELLYREYITNNKSIPTIANESGHSNATISRWLEFFNIPKKTLLDYPPKIGSLNSNWKGTSCCPVCGRSKSYNSNKCASCYFDFRKQQSSPSNRPISNILRELITPWKDKILGRDGRKCMSCDSLDNLQAHHIVPFKVIRDQLIMEYGHIINFDFSTPDNQSLFIDTVKNDKRLWDLDNGVTLCHECHKQEHTRLKNITDQTIYMYYCTVIDVYDGDSLTVEVDLGFGLKKTIDIRLFGVNTEELRSSDIHKKGKAIEAKRAIKQLWIPGSHIKIRTYKAGKYGRWLGILFLDHAIVNDFLLDTGLAEPYIL